MTTALLAASHGTSSAEGQAAVAALVAAVARARPGLATRAAFVDVQRPGVAETLADLAAASTVVVVPLLLSAGYHVHVDLANEVSAASIDAVVANALGPDGRLVACLVDRLRAVGFRPPDRVVLACAGSRDAAAVADCEQMARMLSVALCAPVRAGYISAATPSVADAIAAERAADPRARVLVSSYLLAPGFFASIAAASRADAVAEPLLVPGEQPSARIVELVLERCAEASAAKASRASRP